MSFFGDPQVTETDLLNILKDFHEGTFNGQTINVILEDTFLAANPQEGTVESTQPEALCRTVDVAGAKHGDVIVIKGTIYYIRGIQPDGGHGRTVLILSKE
ncbi:MAG: hypothetical protein QME66_04645 [Candidatus Eisenbacteria bacterium]|nr:hypothetical protein [Candidatus Eisenbacteria bacterium]